MATQQMDVAKLQILMEVGGIFLESDSVVLRSLNDLRKMEAVLGESDQNSLGEYSTIEHLDV